MSAETRRLIQGFDERDCPLVCSAREIEQDGRCVTRTCPNGQTLNSAGNCVEREQTAMRDESPQTTGNKPDPVLYSYQVWEDGSAVFYTQRGTVSADTPYGRLTCSGYTQRSCRRE